MESSRTRDSVAGEIYAVINYPFATVGAALESPSNWCDILILHLNTKYCRASTAGQADVLNVSIGNKTDQPLEKAYRVDFAFQVAARAPDYLQVLGLNADEGPLSTHDYRMVLEAIPLEMGETGIHLVYSYAYGLVGTLGDAGLPRNNREGQGGIHRCRCTTRRPAHPTSAECVVRWNATACAITWQSKPFSAPCRRRRTSDSKGVCKNGLRASSNIHASCMS